MECLEKTHGEHFLKVTPIHFYFTFPAAYSDRAKAEYKNCVHMAGFGKRTRARPNDTISLIPEPEAAALSAIAETTQSPQGFQFKV